MKKEIEMFLSHIQAVERLSQNTVLSYKQDLNRFESYMSDKTITGCEQVETCHVIAYIADTMKDFEPTTVVRHTAAISSFFEYLLNNKQVKVNPAKGFKRAKVGKTVPDIITTAEKDAIMQFAKDPSNSKDTKTWFRNYAMLSLLFATGMRKDELLNIKLEDISLQSNSLLIAKGKGNKQRMAHYSEKTRAVLAEYITAYRPKYNKASESIYLFMGNASTQLNSSTPNRVIDKYMKLANCKKKGRGVHATRKRFATDAYNVSHNIYAVAKIIGHSNLETISKYAQAEEEQNKAICMAL